MELHAPLSIGFNVLLIIHTGQYVVAYATGFETLSFELHRDATSNVYRL